MNKLTTKAYTMKTENPITHLFVDIGGVFLTNGWDHNTRKKAAEHFKLNWEELESRHHLIFESYEEGKFTLEEYLQQIVFYQKRPFTLAQFRKFMFAQSQPYPEMIELFWLLKKLHGLKIFVVSNEGKELNAYRIEKFKMHRFVDAFISSSLVHLRKPDRQIFELAVNISQAALDQIVYIENTPMFVQIAESLGIPSILHTDYASTVKKLEALNLRIDKGVKH